MRLAEVCQRLFAWNEEQWAAFCEICNLMGCGEKLTALTAREYSTAFEALAALNPVLQAHLFRNGVSNPFGRVAERVDLKSGAVTEHHAKVAEQLIRMGLHKEKSPQLEIEADVVGVLGSTIPNMAKRIEFSRDSVLPKIKSEHLVLGLAGKRKLIPIQEDASLGYLGDISAGPIEGHKTYTQEQLGKALPEHRAQDGSHTEVGAMYLLLQELLPDRDAGIVDAPPKRGAIRADTEDTGMQAGIDLIKKYAFAKRHFKFVVVSDACFPGQVEQVRTGLMKAGIFLNQDEIIFFGAGYPEEVVTRSAAYIQILASSLAELVYNTMKRLQLQLNYGISLPFEGPFRTSVDALETHHPDNREWSRE